MVQFNIVKSVIFTKAAAVRFVSSGFVFLTASPTAWNRSSPKEVKFPLMDWLANSHPNSKTSTEEYKNIAVRKNTFQPTHRQKRKMTHYSPFLTITAFKIL